MCFKFNCLKPNLFWVIGTGLRLLKKTPFWKFPRSKPSILFYIPLLFLPESKSQSHAVNDAWVWVGILQPCGWLPHRRVSQPPRPLALLTKKQRKNILRKGLPQHFDSTFLCIFFELFFLLYFNSFFSRHFDSICSLFWSPSVSHWDFYSFLWMIFYLILFWFPLCLLNSHFITILHRYIWFDFFLYFIFPPFFCGV